MTRQYMGRTLAWTVRPLRWILLSEQFVIWNAEPTVREVLLHEVAHALDKTPMMGHTDEWRRIFLRIGGSGYEEPKGVRFPPRRRRRDAARSSS